MKEQCSLEEDHRIKIYEQFFHFQPNPSSQLIHNLFRIVESDLKTQDAFLKGLKSLLESRNQHCKEIFQYCLLKQNKKYINALTQFLRDYFNVNSKKQQFSMILQRNLQLYIIGNIWKPKLKHHREECGLNMKKIMIYLSLKMRSLEYEIRMEAIQSFYCLIQECKVTQEKQTMWILKQTLPKMIQKETLVKKASHSKGVLLQILEDQHNFIKKRCIQLLGLAIEFFEKKVIQPIILYMLNDEHKSVRQTSLIVLTSLKSLKLEKEDLTALLMCLKENNIELRRYVYENIPNIQISEGWELQIILQKLFQALLGFKVDKKRIYTTCGLLGRKWVKIVGQNIHKIFNYKQEEPNWKNLIYKGKVILIANMGKDNWPQTLPQYFSKHYLYIRDMQYYAFQTIKQNNQIPQQQTQIKLNTSHQLRSFIYAEIRVRRGFAQEIFIILDQFIKNLQIKDICVKQRILDEIKKVNVKYYPKKYPKAMFILSEIKQLLSNLQMSQQTFRNILTELNDKTLDKIALTKFQLSKEDSRCIMIVNDEEILKISYIELTTASDRKYVRMSEVEFDDKDEQYCYYEVKMKWKRLRCLIIYSCEPLREYVVDEQ